MTRSTRCSAGILTAGAATAAVLAEVSPASAFEPLFETWMGFITGGCTDACYPYAAAVGFGPLKMGLNNPKRGKWTESQLKKKLTHSPSTPMISENSIQESAFHGTTVQRPDSARSSPSEGYDMRATLNGIEVDESLHQRRAQATDPAPNDQTGDSNAECSRVRGRPDFGRATLLRRK